MIAMMILQDGPRLASYITGNVARRLAHPAGVRRSKEDLTSRFAASCTVAKQRLTRLRSQPSLTQLLQGALVAMLILLLIW